MHLISQCTSHAESREREREKRPWENQTETTAG